jgi:hypothetical protein
MSVKICEEDKPYVAVSRFTSQNRWQNSANDTIMNQHQLLVKENNLRLEAKILFSGQGDNQKPSSFIIIMSPML